MKKIILTLIIALFTKKVYCDDFGFIYKWGNVHTYNSFTKTYIRKTCTDKKIYSVALKLSESELSSIKNQFYDSNFFNSTSNTFEKYTNNETVEVTLPCATKTYFAQIDDKLNYLVFKCIKPIKISSNEEGLLELGRNIERIISSNKNYIEAPHSSCIFE